MTENKTIFDQSFDHVVEVSFDGGKLKVGPLTFSDEHRQDCCESVDADFSAFEHQLKEVKCAPGAGPVVLPLLGQVRSGYHAPSASVVLG
jgi:hypothetical protein